MKDFICDAASLLGKDLKFSATPELQSIIDSLARTEDVRFTTDGRRMAIAGFARNAIMILELSAPPDLTITGSLELHHENIREPHGLDWFDDRRLAVASRRGMVDFIRIPPAEEGQRQQKAAVFNTITKVGFRKEIRTPGSLAIQRHAGGLGVWVCNNYKHRMSHHHLRDKGDHIRVSRNKIAIDEGLRVPDGVSLSDDGCFMAISNHKTHQVLVYRLTDLGQAERIGVLGRIDYPHGLRFVPGGTELIVADAGQPFLHVFRTDTNWVGEHWPVRRVRVMDDQTYLRGRYNVQEGGIKGIDIDVTRGLVATTCEAQTLKLFALSDVLGYD